MKYAVLFVALSNLIVSFAHAQVTLVKKWQSEPGFKVPESVIYDEANKVLYVSNIAGEPWGKDGVGFISKLSTDGKILEAEWVKGLDAPKGMGISKGKLYVADLNRVAVISISGKKIEKFIEVPGAVQLNDVTTDPEGHIYVSDFGGKKIYIIKNDKPELLIEKQEFGKVNGLLYQSDGLKLVDMGTGYFYALSPANKNLNPITSGIPSGDGIVEIGNNEYLISNWNGEIYLIKDGQLLKILDTKSEKINAADIWYVASTKTLFVPTFFGNTVTAYEVNR